MFDYEWVEQGPLISGRSRIFTGHCGKYEIHSPAAMFFFTAAQPESGRK
jgi:hypothetical protein